jgi:hypothetical protein
MPSISPHISLILAPFFLMTGIRSLPRSLYRGSIILWEAGRFAHNLEPPHPPPFVALGHLLVDYTAPCSHPLDLTGTDDPGVAKAVTVLNGAFDHVRDGLDTPVWVPRGIPAGIFGDRRNENRPKAGKDQNPSFRRTRKPASVNPCPLDHRPSAYHFPDLPAFGHHGSPFRHLSCIRSRSRLRHRPSPERRSLRSLGLLFAFLSIAWAWDREYRQEVAIHQVHGPPRSGIPRPFPSLCCRRRFCGSMAIPQ